MTIINPDLKVQVARSAQWLLDKGLSPGRDFGDTSLLDRSSGLIYILPRPSPHQPICDWSKVGPDDVAVIDLQGANVGDPRIQPTVEAPMHLRIYHARPDVGAIVHSHGEWSSVFAGARQSIPAVTLDALETIGVDEIACADYALIASEALGDAVVSALGAKSKAALMANHGAVCVGIDLDEAFLVATLLEKLSMQVVFAKIVGTPVKITWEDFGNAPTYEEMVPPSH